MGPVEDDLPRLGRRLLAPTGLLDPVRDPVSAARWIVLFLLAGGAYCIAWALAVGPAKASDPGVGLVLGMVLLAAGGLMWWRRESIPHVLLALCGPGGVVIVAGANIATEDTSAGSQLFVLYPIVLCASFLSVRLNVISVVLAAVGVALLMVPTMPAAEAATNIVGVSAALTVTVAAILAWRRRNDEALARLNALAVEDPLTGLANRRAFDAELAHATARAERDGTPLSVLLVDIDRFKAINDTRGHQAGDRVLVTAASVLREAVRRADVVARVGGDEFALLLYACPEEEAVRIALDVVVSLRESDHDGPPITASCGVATAPPITAAPDAMIAAADGALYRAKREGRNGTAVASRPSHGTAPARSEVSASPTGAIERNEGP